LDRIFNNKIHFSHSYLLYNVLTHTLTYNGVYVWSFHLPEKTAGKKMSY